MDFALTDEQKAWQDKARAFAETEIRPISMACDAVETPRETFDWEIIRKGSKLGFRTAAVPKAWGGHGVDFVTQAIVMAELARGDSAVSKTFSQCWKWSHLIASACSEDQKKRFLRPFLADDTFVLGKGGTEPNGGSDNRMPPAEDPKAGYRLRAERQGDEWVLNGEKAFIANGPIAKLFFIDVRTNPNVNIRQGGTLFMVPNDTPGFRVGKVFNKRGWRFYQNAELIFENTRVPHANVVGEINGNGRIKGSGEMSSGDVFGDLELAANALGVCDAACEHALAHAKSRRQHGEPLSAQQHIQLKLNRMHMLTEALRSYVMRVAWEHDRKIHTANAGLVMNYSTDVIQEVTEIGLEVFTAGGCRLDPQADKLVRDGFIWSHLAGDVVQRMRVVRRHLLH